MVGGRGFEVSGNGALSGVVQVFFHHRGTEDTEGTESFGGGGRGFEVSGNGAMLGLVQVFFTTEAQRAQRFFMVGVARIRGQWEWRGLGLVGVFFHHRDTEGTEILWWGGADSRSVGMARCWGWYRIFSPQRHRQRFYGGVARIRGQWEWRDVGVGTGFFSPQRHRGHRDFLWWGGKSGHGFSRTSRSVGMARRDCESGGIIRGVAFFSQQGSKKLSSIALS